MQKNLKLILCKLPDLCNLKLPFIVRFSLVLFLIISQLAFVNVFAQNNASSQTIKGKVIDNTGSPIPGVSVSVPGTTIGTITDADGVYSIQINSQITRLLFSFIGFETQTVDINKRNIIDIELVTSTIGLDEVVAVGYGTVSKKNLTTSISKVNTSDISKSASSNMPQLLLGRAAGLQATVASAQPGGNIDISIRGGEQPIYVVDGVVMPSESLEPGSGGTSTVIPAAVNRSGLAGLNPEDIESVEILKDASAAIYGIGAANGVILITTKKGKEGSLKVTYDGSYSVVNNYDYIDPLNAQDYMSMVNSFSKEQYLFKNKMGVYGETDYDNGWTARYTDQQIADAKTTNWRDEILKPGSISNHNLMITGGNKKVIYYVSGNYFNQDGTVSNSSMTRYAMRSNVQLQLFPFLKLTSTTNVNRNKYGNSSVGGTSSGRGAQAAGALTAALSYPSYLPVRGEDGEYTQFLNIPNAVALQDIEDNTNTNGIYLNFSADINLIKKILTAKLLYGNNKEATNRSVYIPSYVYFDQMYKSRGNLANDSRENQTYEATINFNKLFMDFLSFDFVAGVGKYLNSGSELNVAYDGQHDAIGNDNISAASGVYKPGSNRSDDEKRSQFIRANIDILDRYVIASTIRRDGTDKFFPEKKYAIFPSVSMAWKISNETFLSSVSWINLLKLRASYGETGSDNLGSTLYGTFAPYSRVTFNGGAEQYIPITQRGLDYPEVSWQKTTMKNVGIDFYVLNNRLSGSFDLFQNNITHMLDDANTAGLSMFGTYPINGAHLRREGWDASLSGEIIKTPEFLWNSILTLTKYNAIWKDRMPNYDYNEYELRKDAPENARYYYETNGLINADLSNMPESQPANVRFPGYPIIVDKNKDGEITVDDVEMNNEVPDIYFGFGNTFTYKNFDLDIFMYSQLGVNKYNYALDWAHAGNLANEVNNSNTYAKRIWNSESNPNGTLPGIAWNLASVSLPGSAGTDIGYQDASFLRVRNITLGYNIKGALLKQFSQYISNIRVYIDAQNPLTFTNFEGFDPEVRTGGSYKGGKAEYPQTRTFSFGVKINFN
ncbi:MAG: SusC/RagA family TonB-linked outer membrane protein [Marinilabiliaceae bacterium]|nr:SusC/RagA family TonB-linked outer membrane protein [Marinilabiliaceae bacterium]